MKSAIFTFGRFNPPTVGHQKLLDKVKSVAYKGGSDYWVFPSLSQNANKDPLPHNLKVQYMKKAFPECASQIVNDSKIVTALHAMSFLYDKGYTDVSMVVGSDRLTEFKSLLNKYNDTKSRHGYYKFDSINTASAGERDPDAEGVEGMSASKLRQAVKDGNEQLFLSGLPKALSDRDKSQLYKDLKKYMNIKEAYIESSPEFLKHLQGLTPGEVVTEYERDYKKEYAKFQKSNAMKKYRAELNRYNRQKGTYGNGDGKDASHKNGKIAGYEDQSKNRGRREKSRLKGSKRKMSEQQHNTEAVGAAVAASGAYKGGGKLTNADINAVLAKKKKERQAAKAKRIADKEKKTGKKMGTVAKLFAHREHESPFIDSILANAASKSELLEGEMESAEFKSFGDFVAENGKYPHPEKGKKKKKKKSKWGVKESLSFSGWLTENLQNPKQYLKANYSGIKSPSVLSSARKLVQKAKQDGGVVFHMSTDASNVQYAEDINSSEWPGNDALEDGFITVVYAKEFF